MLKFIKIVFSTIFFQLAFTKIYKVAEDFPLDLTASSVTGWSGTILSPGYQQCIHGNVYGPFEGQGGSNIVQKTFNSLPPHYSLSMSLVYWALFSWDYENIIVKIDDTLMYQRSVDIYNTMYQESYCSNPNIGTGSEQWYHRANAMIPIALNITHTSSSAKISFASSIASSGPDEAFGLSQFFLTVDECHYTCASCNGPNEDNCLTCPQNSIKSGNSCQCNSSTTANNHQCISICSSGYTLDTTLRRCVAVCPIQNCQSCQNKLCTTCNSGYFLIKGKCTDKCPWFTTQSGSTCVDSFYNSIARPFVVIEDFINKIYSHSDVQSNNWQQKITFQYNSRVISNYVATQCKGLSLTGGFNNLPFNETCASGCGYTNTFNNLPPHYKATVKYQIWCGDTWDNEPYWVKVDGTEKQRKQFTWVSQPNTRVYVCGRNLNQVNHDNQIKNEQITFDHTSQTLNLELGYMLNQLQWDEWGAYREIQVLLHLCDNENCASCTTSGQSCTSCIGDSGLNRSRDVGNQCKCKSGFYDVGEPLCCKSYACSSCSDDSSCDSCIGSTGQDSSRLQNSLCICPNQYFNNYPTNIECQQCDHVCLTCIDNSSKCTSCITGPNRNEKPDCTCKDGYFEDSNKDCIKCEYQCAKCTGSADNCTECKGSNRSSVFPGCLCNLGYFDDNSNPDCVQCSHPCVNCQSQTFCDSCITGSFRNSNPTCTCQSGYLENTSKTCDKCHHKCNTCENNLDECTQCKGSNRSTSYPSCLCNPGYFDNNTNSDCEQCVHPCVNCTGLNQCTSCVAGDNRIAAPSNCNCISHFFENASKLCVECDYQCLECTNQKDNCSSCQGTNRSNNVPECECNLTFFDDGSNKNCVACVHPCINCQSLTQCDTCVNKPYRNSSPTCNCILGYYEDSNLDCQKCQNNCNTCINQANNCTECKGANRLTEYPSCLCETRYYDDQTNADCVECPLGCAACDNQNVCTDCQDGYYKNNNSCIKCPNKFNKCTDENTGTECAAGTGRSSLIPDCECNPTYFDNNTNSNDCQPCIHPCINCTQSNDNCTSCHQDVNRKDINDCNCKDNYFEESDLTCSICTSPCSKCETSTTNCTECINTLNRQNAPSCLCNLNYFQNENLVCEICQHPCKECNGTALICTECVPGSNRIQDSTCACEPGFYDDGTICQPCDLNKCSTCENSPTECILCADITRGGNDCTCLDTYFEEGVAACGKCDYQCGNCSGSSNSCDTCSDSNRNIDNNCKCIDTFYNDQENPVCQNCVHPCLNCISQKICLSCIGEFRQIPSCSCNQGYFENEEKICELCDTNCKQCLQSASKCLVCQIGFQRTMKVPECGCREGFYEQEGNVNCLQCFTGCKKCEKFTGKCLECNVKTFSTLNCLEESAGKFLETVLDQNNSTLEVQINGKCQIQCLTCENSSDNCTSCKIGLNRNNNAPSCQCLKGYHDSNSTKDDCLKCPNTCQSCLSQNLCTSCFENQNRQLDSISMLCICRKGFTEDINNNCVPCFQYKGQCFQQCPKNTIQNDLSKQCDQLNISYMSNTSIMLVCLLILIIFQIIAFLIVKYFTKKNITKLSNISKNQVKFNQIDNSRDKSSSEIEKA